MKPRGNSTLSVLMLTPFYRAQRGNSRTVERLAQGLAKEGIFPRVFSLEERDWAGQLSKILDTEEIALVHGFHAGYLGKVLAAVPKLNQYPLVLTTTGTDLHGDLQIPAEPRVVQAMQAAKWIVVFHQDFQSRLQERYPQFASKIRTIPQGVSLPNGAPVPREDWGLNPEEFVFLLPSGLRPVKDIAFAIQGLTRLQSTFPQVRLVLVGAVLDREYARDIQGLSADKPWIRYFGAFDHGEMRGILGLGDVVLNTSVAEGQPQGALEAMSLGLPAILRAVPGNQILSHGVEGFYVQTKAELGFWGEKLLTSVQLRQKMGQAAQQLVGRSFQPETELRAYQALYQAVWQE